MPAPTPAAPTDPVPTAVPTSRHTRRGHGLVALAVVAVLGLAGCGGDEPGTDTITPTAPGASDAPSEPSPGAGTAAGDEDLQALVLEGFDDSTPDEVAGLCQSVQLMGADFLVDALLEEDGLPAGITDADPEQLAQAVADICVDVEPVASEAS